MARHFGRQTIISTFLVLWGMLVAPLAQAAMPLPPALPSFRLQTTLSADTMTPLSEIASNTVAVSEVNIRQAVPVEAHVIDDDTLEISFDWASPSGVAVFKRHNRLLIVFDKPALFHLEQASTFDTSYYSNLQQVVDRADLSVVTLKLPSDKHVTIDRSGNSWNIQIRQGSQDENISQALTPQIVEESSIQLFYNYNDIRVLRTFQDPSTGENLFLMFQTVPYPTHGQEYIDYTTLSTAAGIVLAARADDLAVTKTADGFIVSRINNKSLHLSSLADRQASRKYAFPSNLFDFSPWSNISKDWFNTYNSYLLKLINLEGRERIKFRQEIILFLLATGYFPEASAHVQLLESEHPNIIDEPEFQTLKAISLVLTYHSDEAGKIFTTPPCSDEPEIQLWKGVALLSRNNYYEGLQLIIQNVRYLKNYPTSLRNFICLLAAQASYELDYPGKIFLDFMDKNQLSVLQVPLYDLYAYYLNKKPNEDMAKSPVLQALSKSNHPRVRTEATLLLMEGETKDVNADIAILEDLRFRWRGDDTEMAILMKLADLYLKAKKPYNALVYLRQVNAYFANYPNHEEARKKGQDIFYELFMTGNKRPPYQLLALYQEFKELLPTDKRKEIMFDRLIAIYEKMDLLEKASNLLEKALRQPQPSENITAYRALHLSSLYLELKKYEKASQTLKKIPLPMAQEPAIQQAKLFLTAKMYAEQGQLDAALEMLKSDDSFDGLNLQAELCWQAKRWAQAAEFITKIIKATDDKKAKRAEYILKLAVALVYAHNTKGLELVKKAFGAYMEKSKYKDTFLIITSPIDSNAGSTYQKSLEQLSAANNFNNFLRDFRSKGGY
jgi:hypothetical protein